MKKIIVFTSTRAEYGLLKNLIFKLTENKNFNVKILVTGTHLSRKYGLTINEIYEDGFKNIIDKVVIPMSNKIQGSELTGICIQKFSLYLKSNIFDLAIILGDRFEAFAMASACFQNNLEIAHIHGGEKTLGAVDDKLRHCITLMSSFHFTSHKKHLRKVLSLEGSKSKSFISGPMILDSLEKIKFLSKTQLKKELNYNFNQYNLLISYHPVTKEKDYGFRNFKNLLFILDNLIKIQKLPVNILFTYPNCDDGNKQIINEIKNFKKINPKNTFISKSLGHQKYLSAFNFFDLLIGNSSSGIIEAAFFNIKVINIGNRQKGRTKFGEVLESNGTKVNLKNKIIKLLTDKKNCGVVINKIKKTSPSDIIIRALI